MARVVVLRISLGKVTRSADEKIGKIQSGFIPGKSERSVKGGVGGDVHLFEAEFGPGLDGMTSDNPGQVVRRRVGEAVDRGLANLQALRCSEPR